MLYFWNSILHAQERSPAPLCVMAAIRSSLSVFPHVRASPCPALTAILHVRGSPRVLAVASCAKLVQWNRSEEFAILCLKTRISICEELCLFLCVSLLVNFTVCVCHLTLTRIGFTPMVCGCRRHIGTSPCKGRPILRGACT